MTDDIRSPGRPPKRWSDDFEDWTGATVHYLALYNSVETDRHGEELTK